MSDVKKRAMEFLSFGFSVVPIRRGEKAPAIKWEEYQRRKPTEAEIDSWIEYIGDDINLGIVTGKVSNLVVVDVDKDKKTGVLGDVSDLPPTTEARTGSGGRHLYYRYPEDGTEIKNAAGIRPNVDIRGEGGQVVAPGSIHKSGNRYEWINLRRCAPFPKHLLKEMVKPTLATGQRDWSTIQEGASEGQRNETAASVAGKLQRQFSPDEHESVAWPLFEAWNLKNTPPLPDKELRSVWESIKKRSVNDVRFDPEKRVRVVREQIPKGDIEKVNWNDVIRMGERELYMTKPEDCLSFGYNFLDEVLTGIFRGELVVLGGATGSGKSTIAMNTCQRAAKKGHKVFVFALEDRLEDYAIKALFYKVNQFAREEEGITHNYYSWNLFRRNLYNNQKFIERMGRAKSELENENIKFIKVESRLNFATLEKVIDEEVKDGTELFLIDHLHYFELDQNDMTRTNYIENFMVDLRTMQRRNGARVIMVCHYKKLNSELPTLDSFKDSISIVQNANYVINIWRERGESFSGTKKKSNDSINDALLSMQSKNDSRYVETFFLIPKSRNPNGESTILVKYDKLKGDYVDTATLEFRPLDEMEEEPEFRKSQGEQTATDKINWETL